MSAQLVEIIETDDDYIDVSARIPVGKTLVVETKSKVAEIADYENNSEITSSKLNEVQHRFVEYDIWEGGPYKVLKCAQQDCPACKLEQHEKKKLELSQQLQHLSEIENDDAQFYTLANGAKLPKWCQVGTVLSDEQMIAGKLTKRTIMVHWIKEKDNGDAEVTFRCLNGPREYAHDYLSSLQLQWDGFKQADGPQWSKGEIPEYITWHFKPENFELAIQPWTPPSWCKVGMWLFEEHLEDRIFGTKKSQQNLAVITEIKNYCVVLETADGWNSGEIFLDRISEDGIRIYDNVIYKPVNVPAQYKIPNHLSAWQQRRSEDLWFFGGLLNLFVASWMVFLGMPFSTTAIISGIWLLNCIFGWSPTGTHIHHREVKWTSEKFIEYGMGPAHTQECLLNNDSGNCLNIDHGGIRPGMKHYPHWRPLRQIRQENIHKLSDKDIRKMISEADSKPLVLPESWKNAGWIETPTLAEKLADNPLNELNEEGW